MAQLTRPEARANALASAVRVIPPAMALLLAGAAFYYRERMLFTDGPHVLYRIINDGALKISDNRYGSFITQVFPLVGAWLHIPLKWLMVLYSASFNLFYLAVSLLLVFRFRNYGLAIVYGLYQVLFAGETFYWPNNEIHQGVGWLMLALALNAQLAGEKRPLLLSLPVFLGTFFLALWTHPLVMLPAVYLWFFLWLSHPAVYPRRIGFLFSILLLLLAALKFHQGQHHGYDSTKIEALMGFNTSMIASIFHSQQFRFFVKSCVTNYWLFVLLSIWGVISLIRAGKYVILAWTVGCGAVYMALIFITFRDGVFFPFYLESEYMPLSVIGVAPFVYYALPQIRKGWVAALILASVFLVRFGYIVHGAEKFTARVTLLKQINDKMGEKKLTRVIIREPAPAADSVLIMTWGAPVESILLSATRGQMPLREFVFAGADEAARYAHLGKDTVLGCWDWRGPAMINHYYFNPDTSVHYQPIGYDDLMK